MKRIPIPSDRELAGLRQIRTGNITSASEANAADLWIDRVVAICTGRSMENTDEIECKTCLGHGRIRDGETNDLRKCLDCNGAGSAPPTQHHQQGDR